MVLDLCLPYCLSGGAVAHRAVHCVMTDLGHFICSWVVLIHKALVSTPFFMISVNFWHEAPKFCVTAAYVYFSALSMGCCGPSLILKHVWSWWKRGMPCGWSNHSLARVGWPQLQQVCGWTHAGNSQVLHTASRQRSFFWRHELTIRFFQCVVGFGLFQVPKNWEWMLFSFLYAWKHVGTGCICLHFRNVLFFF